MFRWITGRLSCLGGKHQRSEKHVRKQAGQDEYTSICSYCRVPMRRRAKRDWIVSGRAR